MLLDVQAVSYSVFLIRRKSVLVLVKARGPEKLTEQWMDLTYSTLKFLLPGLGFCENYIIDLSDQGHLPLSLYFLDYFQLDPSSPIYGGTVETREIILLRATGLQPHHKHNELQ